MKFVEQLLTCSSTCPIIGTLSHNTYNKVLKEISILWQSITQYEIVIVVQVLYTMVVVGKILISCIHMVGFCGQDCYVSHNWVTYSNGIQDGQLGTDFPQLL